MLPHLPVHDASNLSAIRLRSGDDSWSDRFERVKAFSANPLSVFSLKIARGQLIQPGIAQDLFIDLVLPHSRGETT